MKRKAPFIPDRGDVVWLDFSPHAGHEQAGRRPALVLSPIEYNQKVGLLVCCPITNQAKGYPFEVAIPSGLPVAGVVLSDQVKNLDWNVRRSHRRANNCSRARPLISTRPRLPNGSTSFAATLMNSRCRLAARLFGTPLSPS